MPTAHEVQRAKEFSIVLRDFGGMNLASPRESIDDQDFYWLEDIMPLARGNLQPAPGISALLFTVAGESGSPTYTQQFIGGSTDYVFAVWSGSGNGWIINLATLVQTKIFSGTLMSGKTAAAQWNAQGLLIIDPTGYWDWNVTTALTLTSLTNGILTATVVSKGATITYAGTEIVFTVTITGGVALNAASLKAVGVLTAVTVSGGTGYVLNDVIELSQSGGVASSTPATATVTAVGGGGSLSTVTISSGGTWGGAEALTVSGGSGTGGSATAGIWALSSITIVKPGSYSTNPTSISTNFTSSVISFTMSGFLSGTAICVFAGRSWTANLRVITFTDAGSYFSFAGSGSSFTIEDQYLHDGVTALFNANNNMYIFGDESIDALSNVTVSQGTASFSRINLTASVGTNQPQSVFAFGRAVAFSNSTGFWLMSGATPERVSDKLLQLVQATNFANTVFGGPVVSNSELCACFLITVTDKFTTTSPVVRQLMALNFRNRWWVSSQGGAVIGALTADISTAGGINPNSKQVLYGWIGNSMYQLFSGTAPQWKAITKLYDDDDPLREKQGLTAALAATLSGQTTTGISVTIDTELSSTPAPNLGLLPSVQWINQFGNIVTWVNQFNNPVTWVMNPAGYFLFGPASVQSGQGKQYIGLTVNGGSDVTRLQLIALRAEQTREMLR